ncbi:hypothetical protein R5W23_004891 [Gemmata sp. JC673]|uniref:Sigma-70 family RNA polymerase sigma factor n=1 Tax=Gemmata algarum TaxID=2975278 RepID=A0ABU5F716_9BACT|nr:hypothetical protein [Gemmata algarum]MDY3563388.1 hypothetical protein [Gemmata algarum]
MSECPDRSGPDNPIDPTAAAIIRRKARRMVGRAGLRPQDREDIEHDLVLRVLVQRHRFDDGRGTWPAFVWRVVERAGDNILRSRRRAKRAGRPAESLTAGSATADPAESSARAADLARALAALPPELRAVAVLLTTHTAAAAARALGLSRSTVYARLQRIRARPEWAGLAEYL